MSPHGPESGPPNHPFSPASRPSPNSRHPLPKRPQDPNRPGLLGDVGLIRNRAKLKSAVTNAKAFLEVQRAFGSFDA